MKSLYVISFLLGCSGHLWLNDLEASAQNLGNARILQIDIPANDIVFDNTRGLLYASVGSLTGAPYGNSIVAFDPSTLSIVDYVATGNNPNQLAISKDGSRVYVGVDGMRSVRYWSPQTNEIGPLHALYSEYYDPAVAEDLVVSPLDSNRVIVSVDEVGSTANGSLQVFEGDSGFISGGGIESRFDDANSLAFVNDTTMMTFNSSSTGFELKRHSFDGTKFTLQDRIRGLVSGFGVNIEYSDGAIFATDGRVVDPFTLTAFGTFPDSGAMEPIAGSDTTYFFGERRLSVYDNSTFLRIDSIEFDRSIAADIRELIAIGNSRFAYVSESGQIGVISIPEPSCLLLIPCLWLATLVPRPVRVPKRFP